MSNEPTITPPQRAHLAALLVGAAVAIPGAALGAWALGADAGTIEATSLAITLTTLLLCWPALIGTPMPVLRWGALVVAGSSLRLFGLLAIAGVLDLMLMVDRQGYWLAIAIGGAIQLAIETGVLIGAINGMKPALAGAASGGGHA